MTEPLVSICCVTYNHVDFIKKTLEGFLMQETNFDYEICIGEDESNDGTRQICQNFAKKNPEQIRLFLRSRKYVTFINGYATGRYNFLETLKECKGKYIALCEGDDFWTDPLKLQKQVEFLIQNNDYIMCYHKVAEPNIKPNNSKYYKKEIDSRFIPTCSVVFENNPKIIYQLERYGDGILSGDQLLFYILSFNGKMKLMNFIGGVYNQTKNGTSRSIGIRSKTWSINRILMYSTILKISPLKKKINLIKVAQNAVFNALKLGLKEPLIKYPYQSLKIIVLGLIFHPRYTFYRAKNLIKNKGI